MLIKWQMDNLLENEEVVRYLGSMDDDYESTEEDEIETYETDDFS